MNELILPETFNAATAFIDTNLEAGRGAKTALFYGEQQISYHDVWTHVNRTGNVLRALGVEVEQRVALLLLDSPEFVYSFFGTIKIGAVAVPLNTWLRPADYRYLLNDCRAKVLIVNAALLPLINTIRDDLRYLRHLIVVGDTGTDDNYHRMLAAASPDLQAEPTSKDDMAFWLYSSGSTGVPKGAVHLHHDMLYVSDLFGQQFLQLTPEDRTFAASKLFFAYGLGNNLYIPLRLGLSAVLLPDRPTPDTVFATIARYQPTVFFAVPTLYAHMLQAADTAPPPDLHSLRLCFAAGEALPAEIFQRWKARFGLEIYDVIGSTEALHVFIGNRPGQLRVGSSGRVVPGFEARIVDENGCDVGVEEVGTLLVRGDSTAPLYWNQHRKSQQTMVGEWLNTGDQFRRDSDGYYWFVGRADDMLKVGGIWVSPVEVEHTLMAHEAVLEAAVVGAMDSDHLVKPKAYVLLRQGYNASLELEQDLKTFVKEKIAVYKYPRWIEFVTELPKTATGKIQRFKLRQA
jgi:benzoate-CoA ligase